MRYRRHGARLLGLLAVMALGGVGLAASAQAVTPGFLINKKPVGALLATLSAEQEGRGSVSMPGLNFELNCERFTVDEGNIENNTDAKIRLLYTECTALSISKLPEEIHCHVAEPVNAEALVLPAELKNGEPALLLEKIKALVRLWLPSVTEPLKKECLLPNDNQFTGEICLKVAPETNDKVTLLVEASETIQEECKERKTLEALGEEVASGGFKDLLKYGGQDVFLTAKAKLFLTGAHNGLTLGVSLY